MMIRLASSLVFSAILASPPTFFVLTAARADAQGRVEVEAVAGRPFGVGRIVFDPAPDMLPEPLGAEGIGLTDKDGRVLYPTVDSPAIGRAIKELLDRDTPLTTGGPVREEVGGVLRGLLDRPPRTTIYFLFRGDGPLDLSLDLQRTVSLRAVPRNAPGLHRRLMAMWWRQYAKPDGLLVMKPDYPPMVEQYLTAMLARRLNLRLPERRQTPSAYAELREELGLNLGSESLRMEMLQDRMLGLNNLDRPADVAAPTWPEARELETPEPAADVKIEPIAMHVPPEFFYVRFGNFGNFLWMQDTLAKWGGDAQNLIALRGLDRGMSGRIEKQLVLKQTTISRMLGGTVIADVAIVGTDLFFREGAAYGILFQARNNFALSSSLAQQRAERVAAGGAKEEKIEIGGQKVAYLSSPDGTVRSYYAVSGDFHFVTTSRRLAERFLEVGKDKKSLGALKEFRHARSVMPLDRDDTIWVYFSSVFFHHFTGPQYRIEMTRRLQAAADIELVQLARLAAEAEGRPAGTIEELQAGGFLPQEPIALPGGSRTVIDGGEVYDSLRGRRGSFTPVADAPIGSVTAAELSDFNGFREFYKTQWGGQLDPIIAGVKRIALKDRREQVVIDVRMSPFAPQHFTMLKRWLGPADSRQLAPVAGDMAAMEWTTPDGRIFGGLRDATPSSHSGALGLLPFGRLREYVAGYIGADGSLGPLGFLSLGFPQADAAGYSVSPLGAWRRQYDRFTVFSFQREVLDAVVPQLGYQQTQALRPAQIRLHVGDVSNARITSVLNDLAYARARETSLNNLRLLRDLDQQLRVPPASCLKTAEFLLDGKLVCPLGGKYVLAGDAGAAHWTSTALKSGTSGGFLKVRAPEGHRSPPLNWFRGLDLDAIVTEGSVSAHAEVIMETSK